MTGRNIRPSVLFRQLTIEEQQEALALLKQGLSLRQVAKRFGVNHETLRKLVRRVEGEQE